MLTAAASVRMRRQSGAALIEFALVLPLLLAIAVGIVYYGYAFVLKTSVENAAKNGAQEMVAISPLSQDYSDTTLIDRAQRIVADSLVWLPTSVTEAVTTNVGPGECDGNGVYGVTVTLPLTSGENPILPQFSLGRFNIPPLPQGDNGEPARIRSTACVTL